jgi:hypothetical protein
MIDHTYIHNITIRYVVCEADRRGLFDALGYKGREVDQRLRRRAQSRHGVPLLVATDERIYFSGKHVRSAFKLSATQLSLTASGHLDFSFSGPDGERRLLDICELLAAEYGLTMNYAAWTPAGVTYVETMVCLDVADAQIIARNFDRKLDKRLLHLNKSTLLALPVVFAVHGVGCTRAELCIYQLKPHINQTPDHFKLEVRPLGRHRVRGNPAAVVRTLPTEPPHTWLVVAHAFARWIGEITNGHELLPVPPIWKSMRLPVEGPVPALQGRLIGQDHATPDEGLLVPDLVAGLQYAVVPSELFDSWSPEQRHHWGHGGRNAP